MLSYTPAFVPAARMQNWVTGAAAGEPTTDTDTLVLAGGRCPTALCALKQELRAVTCG